MYGQTPFGLAQQLGINNEEAAGFISRYFERYQGVQRYIEVPQNPTLSINATNILGYIAAKNNDHRQFQAQVRLAF